MDDHDKLAPFKFHDVHVRLKGNEAIGTCPFCDKEKHFFVSPKTGQWECKVGCGSGNLYTFLQRIHEDALKRTKKGDYERLSSLRDGMPWQIFRDNRFAFDKRTSRWLLPLYNTKGALANMLVFAPPKIPKLMGTSGCAQHLFGGEKVMPSGPIYLCEGQWDAMAMRWLLEKNNIDMAVASVLAVPGSSTFKKEWVDLFKNREVFLLFDNDTAGSQGMDKIEIMLDKKASKVRRIHWPSDFPDKYDLRDYVTHRADKPKQALTGLKALFPEKSATTSKKPKLVRNTFQSVLKDFRKLIHTDKAWEEAMAVCMAVVASRKLKNDPLWLFLVGPPGAGKTLLVESFMNLPEQTKYLSKITRPALVSGFRGEEDYSILGVLNERCLIVKDYTAIVSLPLGVQEELYGILRDAYDGHVTVPFGNMEPKSFNTYFSMIASVTDVIRTHNRAALGERFLKMELLDESHDPRVHIRTALSSIENNINEKAEAEEFLRDSVAAFMERPFDERKLPSIPAWLTERLVNLAQLGAYLRAVVAKQGGELSYRPRPEVGTRFAKVLAKLARCLCWVYDKKKIDDQIYSLVQRLALDTVMGWDLEILHALYMAGKNGQTVADLSAKMQLAPTGISNRLNNLKELGITYHTDEIRKTAVGRKAHIWFMSPTLYDLWKGAAMEYAPPPVVTFKRGCPDFKPKRKESKHGKRRPTAVRSKSGSRRTNRRLRAA